VFCLPASSLQHAVSSSDGKESEDSDENDRNGTRDTDSYATLDSWER
jgi:hypothetical protein